MVIWAYSFILNKIINTVLSFGYHPNPPPLLDGALSKNKFTHPQGLSFCEFRLVLHSMTLTTFKKKKKWPQSNLPQYRPSYVTRMLLLRFFFLLIVCVLASLFIFLCINLHLFIKPKKKKKKACTGSGKTLAFLIPIVEILLRRKHQLLPQQVGKQNSINKQDTQKKIPTNRNCCRKNCIPVYIYCIYIYACMCAERKLKRAYFVIIITV